MSETSPTSCPGQSLQIQGWIGVKKRGSRSSVRVIIVILLCFGEYWLRKDFTAEPPKYSPVSNVVWLNQNWTAEQRDWFHHANQGTLTFGIPYEWFIALEQPALPFTEHELPE